MLYIYRRRPSTGATLLAEALDAVRFRARMVPIATKAKAGDNVVCWGEAFPDARPGVRVLNGAPIQSKYEDAVKLKAAGVPTVEVSRTKPTATRQVPTVDPLIQAWQDAQELSATFIGTIPSRTNVAKAALDQLRTSLTNLRQMTDVAAPAPTVVPTAEWLPRSNNHVGGNDLLTPPETIDYYSRKETIVREFRIHSFLGKSIRAGVKTPREGYAQPGITGATQVAHAWIRSWDGGWRIKYDGVTSKQKHRDLAHAAVKALGLDFGAVDIGELADGKLIVLEVNRAPGLEGGTVDVYANHINTWKNNAGD